MDPAALAIVSRSCTNCHSENTEWPAYSYVAPFSWMIEKDVRDARRHMNLSRWAGYDAEQRQSMLARMGSMVRNRLMPPERYLMLHPSARLSDPEAEALYQWTRSARRRLSAADAALHSRWICAVLPLPEAGRRSHKLG